MANAVDYIRFILQATAVYKRITSPFFSLTLLCFDIMILDVLDGYLARKFDQKTKLGNLLDAVLDTSNRMCFILVVIQSKGNPLNFALCIFILIDVFCLMTRRITVAHMDVANEIKESSVGSTFKLYEDKASTPVFCLGLCSFFVLDYLVYGYGVSSIVLTGLYYASGLIFFAMVFFRLRSIIRNGYYIRNIEKEIKGQ